MSGDLVVANETILTINVTGFVREPPFWKNEFGQKITAISANFDGMANKDNATVPVDSRSVKVQLENASNYPATVNLIRPSGCNIGVSKVDDSHVIVIEDGNLLSNNTLINFDQDKLKTIAIRFDAAGSYGDKTGLVNCAVSGSLIYSY